MKTNDNKQAAIVAGAIMAVILMSAIVVHNFSLRKDLNGEKIRSEVLLSEKLQLDKSIDRLKNDLQGMKGKNDQLDRKVSTMTSKLEGMEKDYKRALAENATLRSSRAKVKELEVLTENLTNELNALKTEAQREKNMLMAENRSMAEQLTAMQTEREQLTLSNTILKAMAGNNYRVEAVRGRNDKLTANARRAQKLIFTFDLPNDIGGEISFRLETPDGKKYASRDSQLATVKVTSNNDNFYASLSGMGSIGTKRVEMSFIPNERLTKGLYEFDVYSNEVYIGSTRLRLR